MVPQLLSSDKVVDVPWRAGRADAQVQVWRRQSSPTVAVAEKSVETPHVFLDKVVDMPVVCNNRCLVSWSRKLRTLRICSSSTVVNVPVITHRRLSVHRQSRGQTSCATGHGTRLSAMVVYVAMSVGF